MERLRQLIYNILVTKYISNKDFEYLDIWGKILASIYWSIKEYYHCILKATPCQDVFGRDMIFNIESILDWLVINSRKHLQVDMDNSCKNYTQVIHNYAVGGIVHMDKNCIY